MLTFALPLLATLSAPTPTEPVDFLRDVWPIFEKSCVECHGPAKQKGKLRVDRREQLFGAEPGKGVVVPGDVDGSLLFEYVTLPADDPYFMPEGGDPLSKEQIDLLRRWIEEGAAFEQPAEGPAAEEQLVLPPLSAEELAARDAALARLGELGHQPLQVAQGLEALDLNLSLARDAAGDEAARALEGLAPVLVWLNLSRTAVTDDGLASIGKLRELRRLNLSRTAVTDAGLAHLGGLAHLEVLNLYGTGIGDDGLAHLSALPALRKVYLWQTHVTDAGAAALAEARPGIVLNRGEELAPPPPAANPVNAACPVSGQPVDASFTSEVRGVQVAFCCGDCKAKFDADPAAFVDKIPELANASPINETCPVSGAAVDPAVTSKAGDKVVAFCCTKCKAAFDADPAPFLEKLGLGK